jgi:hypothetical protein
MTVEGYMAVGQEEDAGMGDPEMGTEGATSDKQVNLVTVKGIFQSNNEFSSCCRIRTNRQC